MKTLRQILSYTFIVLSICSMPSQAQDIDLYSSVPKVTGSDLPNILFLLDNAANWNANSSTTCTYADGTGAPSLGTTTGGIEQCALVNAIAALPLQSNGSALVNVGIMFYNANGMNALYGCNASNNGGCLMYPLTAMTAANKALIIAKIKAFSGTAQQANNEATAQLMQEAWAYYAGKTGMSGTAYTSTALTGCQKNYTVFIGNAINNSGSPGDASATPGTLLTTTINGNAALTATQKTLLNTTIQIPSAPYGTSTFTCSPNPYTMGTHSDVSGLYADEWARYMKDVDLVSGLMPGLKTITTYSIGVLSSACKADFPALLSSMARNGSGKYFATGNATELQQAILRIFNEVQAVNSVFASSSLPVSVNAQGTYLNQIYMGMFRPDSGGQPRWYGNLKQYQFIYNSTTKTLQLADATGTPAISAAGTGFMSPNAASFWNCSSSLNPWAAIAPYTVIPTCSPAEPAMGFWANQTSGVGNAYDMPDGEMVEKGGSAMVMRLANLINTYTALPSTATNPRNLYTYCPSGAACGGSGTLLSAAQFDTSNTAITDAMLGTGPVTISTITSAATVNPSSPVAGGWAAPWGSGVASPTISITALAKSGSTVTATVTPASDVAAKLAVGTQLKITTGAAKYDCNPCIVTAINTPSTGTFTYANSGGAGTPTLPSTASIYSNYVEFYSPTVHGLLAGQTVTISGCTLQPTLNGTIGAVSSQWMGTTWFVVGVATPITWAGFDTACQYTPNTATVTTSSAHNLSNGSAVTVAGASPVGYNGTWTISVTGTSTFTYQYTVAAPLANFAAAGATVTSTSTTRDALTRWVRGEDNYGDEQSLCPPGTVAGTGNCPSTAVNIRPSVHGDVLHSRPVVINYGGSTGVVVFYGANDGVYRAINGNQTNPAGTTLPAPGGELWGFIPTEFYSTLKRLHDNSPIILGPSTLPGIVPPPQLKDYFADGPTGLYQLIKSDGTTQTAYIYLAMRRGGRFIYALDVSVPTAPKFLWKHSNADTGFSELGQTWSQPKVAMVKGYANPVLIFAGGYDPAEDTDPPTTADTMGRGIFVLDAASGALIWKAAYGAALSCPSATAACTLPAMQYSIPSDITLIDHDNDGKIDRLYVGDTGGNVWRVDLEPTAGTAPANWQVEKLAALGCSTGACTLGTVPRKIMYPPEVISVTGYDAVFTGTGDREHPLYNSAANSACGVTNRLYMLKDTKTGKDGSALTTITETPGSASPFNLFNASATPYDGSLSGYYVNLGACEKVVNAPLAVAGFVYFGANQAEAPKPNKCEEPLGESASYKLAPFSGTVTETEWESGGLPPSPVAGVVNVVDSVTGKTVQVPFCIGCGSGADDGKGVSSTCDASALAACRPVINVSTSRSRTYWYMNTD
ncbi:MAG: hypothetical protein HY016_03570 [Nitrosomonadales bacterium]|nr:hypothetical protein [Nitrosomonadales bacterium]